MFHSSRTMRRSRQREEGASRCWAVARSAVLGLSLAFACQFALAQAMYRIKPLGTLGGCTASAPVAFGFNAADQITGQACNSNGDPHAFLWRNDGKLMVDLGPDEVGSTSTGYAINASGLVVGSAQDSTGEFGFVSSGQGAAMTRILNVWGGTYIQALALNDSGQVTGSASSPGQYGFHAFLWKNDGSPMLELARLESFCGETGDAINASGQVAGFAYDCDRGYYAFIWKNDGSPMVNLGNVGGYRTRPCCINASGQVAGTDARGSRSTAYAFLWRNDGTGMHDLGSLGGAESAANALNASGQVAGWSDTNGLLKRHAFVWMNDGTPMKNLGTLGGTKSVSNDINASGQVTGWAYPAGDLIIHAFLWRNDGTKMQDLNTLVDPTDPLKPYITLTNGEFINKLGDIAAEGTDSRTGLGGLYLLQGTVLTLAPRSLAFGNIQINSSSAAKSVTVTNTSAKAVPITSIALVGSAPGQFASTNTCGKSLASHAICTIKVTFKPTTKGAKTAALNVNGGGSGLRSVALAGTGT